MELEALESIFEGSFTMNTPHDESTGGASYELYLVRVWVVCSMCSVWAACSVIIVYSVCCIWCVCGLRSVCILCLCVHLSF
jgi:hypothetical protein